jgi:hypothetical protein
MGLANVSMNTLRRLVSQGLLPAPARLSNRSFRWDLKAVAAALDKLREGSAATAGGGSTRT